MNFEKYNRRIIIRYSLFQIPALLVVVLTIFLIDKFYIIDNKIIIGIILIWMIKDIIIFPFVWKSYSLKDRDRLKNMIAEQGIAMSSVNPKGFIKINGEIWQAENDEINMMIQEGDFVEIVEINGMVLKIKKVS